MSGPRRTKGETLPVATEQLAELKRQTETKVPVVKANPALAPTRNIIPARRGNSGHAIVPPPPPLDDGDVSEEVVIEMSDDDDEPAPPRRARSDTLADPLTTSKLAEAARGAPTPPVASGPNRNVKRRGG